MFPRLSTIGEDLDIGHTHKGGQYLASKALERGVSGVDIKRYHLDVLEKAYIYLKLDFVHFLA